MNREELKKIAESLIDTFNIAGQDSIDLYKKGLKIEFAISPAISAPLPANPNVEEESPYNIFVVDWVAFYCICK